MTTEQTFVIVGASLAGAKAAEALRTQGFDGRIVLLGEEREYPYARPALSKNFLMDRSEKDKIFVHAAHWYDEHQIDLRLGTRVVAIDLAAHQVRTSVGDVLSYTKLLLTTGSSPRRAELPGGDTEGVRYLRTVADCERLKKSLQSAARVVVVGGGWIGLEVAAAARTLGVEVTVLERSELPLQRVLGRDLAQVYAEVHREHGVDLRCGVQAVEITADDGATTGVRLSDGTHVAAEVVVIGVGATPNVELAEAAGLTVGNGITVDEHLCSSDPDVYAAGDVASAYHPLLGKHIRVEHWANALNEPAIAAEAMRGGDAAYQRLPYFFSDQYDFGMEYSGYVEPDGYDEVVLRGDVGKREFLAFWIKDHVVLAGMNVNIWDATEAIQSLIASRAAIDPVKLADATVPLSQVSQVSQVSQ